MNQKLPKPMLDALAREAAPAGHPSADVLAAFLGQPLAEGEKQSVTDHLARCSECREIVFLASDAAEGAATEQHSVAAKPRWRWTWRWIWAAPAAAILLIVAGYLVRQSYVPAPAESEIAPKKVATEESRPPEQVQDATPAQPSSAVTAPSPMAKARPRTTPATTPPARKAQPVGADAVATNAAPAPAEREAQHATSASPKPAPEAPAIAIGGALANTAPEAPKANGFAPTTGEAVQQYRAADSLRLSVNRSLAGLAQTAHPGWHVTPQGHLERLTPDGWSRVLADQPSAFRVVSVIGSDVWAGGNDGVLFHSGDRGMHWNKVSIANPSGAETAAIVSIRFDNSQHGVIVTDAGASYSTADAGVTWTKQ